MIRTRAENRVERIEIPTSDVKKIYHPGVPEVAAGSVALVIGLGVLTGGLLTLASLESEENVNESAGFGYAIAETMLAVGGGLAVVGAVPMVWGLYTWRSSVKRSKPRVVLLPSVGPDGVGLQLAIR